MNHQYDYLQMFECIKYHLWLVVWNIFYVFHILGIIIPTDFHIFQRGGSTTDQIGLQSTFFNVCHEMSIVGNPFPLPWPWCPEVKVRVSYQKLLKVWLLKVWVLNLGASVAINPLDN